MRCRVWKHLASSVGAVEASKLSSHDRVISRLLFGRKVIALGADSVSLVGDRVEYAQNLVAADWTRDFVPSQSPVWRIQTLLTLRTPDDPILAPTSLPPSAAPTKSPTALVPSRGLSKVHHPLALAAL
jgi:hypothetical protein